MLQDGILGAWTPTTNVGIFNCRPTADGAPSVHGNGRAGDIGCAGTVGASIASWLVANHTALGVQVVIWDHRIWSVTHSAEGWRPYGCDKPGSKKDHHTTHVHWEINIDAAGRLTRQFVASLLPIHPQPDPTPDPVPLPEEIPDMDFFILNDANDDTADQWYWWPELGGEKGTRAIIPRGTAITKAKASRRFCGELEFDRPDLDAIPTVR